MKIKGHTSIILKDVKTGEIERYEDDNLITNAITKYFENCGFLNYPNINQGNMVEDMLGGVMAFDDEIAESASTIHVPAGVRMIANGSVGVVNNGEVLEMGSYSTTESGWQDDGSYIQTYDYTTSQANGTIACVCLTNKNYGFYGEGNSISLKKHDTPVNIFSLRGNFTDYTISGTPFNINLSDSSCYTFAKVNVEEEQGGQIVTVVKGRIRKYRLPFSKINIKGTPEEPIILSESYITLDDELKTALIKLQPLGDNLIMWNVSDGTPVWGSGSWTQYVWTLTPSGTLTRQTVINTYGEDLTGLQAAIFDGNYCFFIKAYGTYFDNTKIYVWNRTTGTITAINNPLGAVISSSNWRGSLAVAGWDLVHRSGDGRIVTAGTATQTSPLHSYVVDAVLGACYPANKNSSLLFHYCISPDNLITFDVISNKLRIYRDQSYIASINNLETPVVKTAEKTMKIIYRLTFEEV